MRNDYMSLGPADGDVIAQPLLTNSKASADATVSSSTINLVSWQRIMTISVLIRDRAGQERRGGRPVELAVGVPYGLEPDRAGAHGDRLRIKRVLLYHSGPLLPDGEGVHLQGNR